MATVEEMGQRQADLSRLASALEAAARTVRGLSHQELQVEMKGNDDPVTEVDRAVNRELHRLLVREGEGWLSEEAGENPDRLGKQRVWVVDPLDGTREFVAGIPEYCVSIALVEEGEAVAGAICNPATNEFFLGSKETGVTLNGRPVQPRACPDVRTALVLASRSEVNRGEWKHCRGLPFTLQPMGSIAYKLARVAAGLADATWTLAPRHEWDVAAGVALVRAAGGVVRTLDEHKPHFNRVWPRLEGLLAFSPEAQAQLEPLALASWRGSRRGAC